MPIPLIITRPITESNDFAAMVASQYPGKFQPVISPLLEIRGEPGSVDVSGAQALMFTSRHGVREFAKRSTARDIPALCVGDATAREASAHGMAATSAGGDVSDLAVLAAQSYLPDFGFMLHFRGAETAGDLAGSLMAEGIPAEERIIYDQFPLHLNDIAKQAMSGNAAVAVLFSPRSANLFADDLRATNTRGLDIIAISANAAAPIDPRLVSRIMVAQSPNLEAVINALGNI